MFKIIVLSNIFFCPKGIFFKINNISLKINVCDFFLNNGLLINNYCGGFGQCNKCSFFVNEGPKNYYNKFFKSCNLFNLKNNIIISF